MVTKSPQSAFSRVERLTCVCAVLFATMLANILLFTFENTAGEQLASEPPLFKLGPLSVSSFSVTMGIIGALISVPFNLLVLTLFTAREHYVFKSQHLQTTEKYRTDAKKLHNPLVIDEIEGLECDDNDSGETEKETGCVGRYCSKLH